MTHQERLEEARKIAGRDDRLATAIYDLLMRLPGCTDPIANCAACRSNVNAVDLLVGAVRGRSHAHTGKRVSRLLDE